MIKMAIQKHLSNLPTKIEDIQRYILVGTAKVQANIRAIQAIEKGNIAVSAAALQAALNDTQDLAEELLYAEARLGKDLSENANKKPITDGSQKKLSGSVSKLPPNITKKQSHQAQELSRNEDAIAQTVVKAREKGEVPVRQQVLKAIQAKKREAEKEKIAKRGKIAGPNEKYHVEIGDIQTYQTRKKFDFIITDPPYPKEYLELYGLLAKRANEWLNPGGLVIAMCGQSYLDRIIALMSTHLEYYWTACYLTPGQPTPLRQKQVNTNWKPLLLFTRKGEKYKGKTFGDVFRSDANDKSKHKWGQSVSGMFSIISSVCRPGQSVFDPFMGAATTGVAALKHNCFFFGIDIDAECVALSKGRLVNDSKT